MGFRNAVRTGLSRYAVWRGRASRSEYWWFVLFNALCYAAGTVLTIELSIPVVLLVYLALVLPTISVLIRRLHDIDRSGAWFFIGFVPFGFIVLLVFSCTRGDPHPNRFGPPSTQTSGDFAGFAPM